MSLLLASLCNSKAHDTQIQNMLPMSRACMAGRAYQQGAWGSPGACPFICVHALLIASVWEAQHDAPAPEVIVRAGQYYVSMMALAYQQQMSAQNGEIWVPKQRAAVTDMGS